MDSGLITMTNEIAFNITKELSLRAAQAGNDARFRDETNETIIRCATSTNIIFKILSGNVSIDGFFI